MTSLWLIDPAKLAKPSATRRKIGRKPLINLAGLQAAIESGQLAEVWVGTVRAEHRLEDLEWTHEDLLDCIRCLRTDDHKSAEWCEDSYGNWHPCDAYAIRYDEVAKRRDRYSDINHYLKFSLDEDGALTLILISFHL